MSYREAIETYERIYRRVDLAAVRDLWSANQGRLHVYVHSPFCASICRFCYYKGVEFQATENADLYRRYYDAYLPAAVAPFLPMLETRPVDNYFFGGGTPSLMTPETMRSVFGLFPGFRDVVSKTFEVHPAVWQEEQLDVLAEHRFNCSIIGVQSFDAKVLERQRRLHAPFEKVQELAQGIRARGMHLATDLIYRMDAIDADAIFARDLELMGELEADVISLQLNYDDVDRDQHTDAFFEHIFRSGLARDYRWEGDGEITRDQKKTMKCFRYVKKGIPMEHYARRIFPFIVSMDEVSKFRPELSELPSVIGFGSYRNPRKNTFSNLRGSDSTVEYIEVNDEWEPSYFITWESGGQDFFEACAAELDRLREIGPPPRGVLIRFENKVARAKEDYIYRRKHADVEMSVSWGWVDPEIEAYLKKLKVLFPHWNWKANQPAPSSPSSE